MQLVNRIAIIAILLFIAAPFTKAQVGGEIVIGATHIIHSNVLDEDRVLWIHTPAGYEQGNEAYPVMILLDGNAHFHHTVGLVQYFSARRLMPDMIIVGVLNSDRTRDMTPEPNANEKERLPTAGGADTFLEMIDEEVMGYVEDNFRTQPYRMLVGHSFGGLFSMYTLFNEPDAFDSYIAISPSFVWHDNMLLKLGSEFLASGNAEGKALYFSMGAERDEMVAGAARMDSLMKADAPESFRWDYLHLPDDNHGTTPHLTIYEGLLHIFDGWRVPREVVDQGLDAIIDYQEKLSERVGYEITPVEVEINLYGYQMLLTDHIDKALEFFEYNIEQHPNSANVYDSYGEGLEAAGQLQKAKENYEKAVELGEQQNSPLLDAFKDHVQKINKKLAEN